MPWDAFSDDCPGCRPAILDVRTKRPLPDDHPIMQAMLEVWKGTTLEQRRAYHAVMCDNSRKPEHLNTVQEIIGKFMERASQ
jgi:hypothetical protein